jgi:hypothetical protein
VLPAAIERDRGNVDDPAPAFLLHARQCGSNTHEVGFDIDPLDLPVLLDGVVLEGTRRIHRRIVDDDVETAGLFCETGKLARQRVGVREIETALDEAGGLRLGNSLAQFLALDRIIVDRNDTGTGFQHVQARRHAQSTCCPGIEHRLAGQG